MDERERLQSPDAAQRAAAAEALSQMATDASIAAVELVRACADDENVRDFAVAALEELGPPPAKTLEPLSKLTSSDNALVAYWAITLLGRAGGEAKFVQDNLASVLTTAHDNGVRERAAWALEKIGANSEKAILGLKQAADSSEPRISRLAKAALEQTKT